MDTGSGSANCQACDVVILNCESCSVHSGTTSVFCDGCYEGYFINGQSCSSCSVAINHCHRCTNGVSCSECKNGYDLINGGCYNTTCDISVIELSCMCS